HDQRGDTDPALLHVEDAGVRVLHEQRVPYSHQVPFPTTCKIPTATLLTPAVRRPCTSTRIGAPTPDRLGATRVPSMSASTLTPEPTVSTEEMPWPVARSPRRSSALVPTPLTTRTRTRTLGCWGSAEHVHRLTNVPEVVVTGGLVSSEVA